MYKHLLLSKGLPAAKVNSALISAGLDAGADPLDDISGLFGFGAEALSRHYWWFT